MIQRKPRISKKKQTLLLKRFIVGDTATAAAIETKVNRNTANLYFTWYRELIYEAYSKAPRFEGDIEMDQAFFGKGIKRAGEEARQAQRRREAFGDEWKPKGSKKKRLKKDNKVMVFGIFQRGRGVYTHIIKRADRNTLFSVIHMVVEPGSTIFTDKWQGFNGLKIDGYEHKTVNHALGPAGKDGAHTGNIDSFWGQAKFHLSRFKGVSRRRFALHLKEIEVRHNNKGNFLKVMRGLIRKSKEDPEIQK